MVKFLARKKTHKKVKRLTVFKRTGLLTYPDQFPYNLQLRGFLRGRYYRPVIVTIHGWFLSAALDLQVPRTDLGPRKARNECPSNRSTVHVRSQNANIRRFENASVSFMIFQNK